MFMDFLSNLPYCLIAAVGAILVAKNILKERLNKSIYINVVILIIYTIVLCITYNEEYVPLQTLIEILALSLTIKQLFEVKILTAFMTCIVILVLMMISEVILLINPLFLDNAMIIRENFFVFTLTNILVMLIAYIISKIRLINGIINKFLNKFEKKSKRNDVMVLIILIISIAFFCYLVFLNRNVQINNSIFLIFIAILCSFFGFYIYEKARYDNLIIRYNMILENAYDYEEKLDKDKLIRHEHKNQLAVIKGMTKNKKVINYIDELLKNNKDEDNINTKGINNIPKGGLRGLIYYKLCLINKKKINYSLDVSKNVKREFANLSDNDKKLLSYLIGIFLDNAIDECEEKTDSNISIEIYKLGKDINIIISNTFHGKINLAKIGEKGYTTKGKSHGNGLFLIKKLLKENNVIKVNTKIINNYFVQEIKINTTKKDA